MVKKIPTRLETHGHVRVDDYYWLRERDNPEVIEYLNEENECAAKEMAHTQAFEEKLFEEIKGADQTDRHVGAVQARRLFLLHALRGREGISDLCAQARLRSMQPEEIMLDGNVLAQGHEFFSIGGSAVSSGQDLIAYAVDTQGRRIHTTY